MAIVVGVVVVVVVVVVKERRPWLGKLRREEKSDESVEGEEETREGTLLWANAAHSWSAEHGKRRMLFFLVLGKY